MKRILAMILAGGQGKRMDILCHFRPKSILPFAGRFRVIDFSLSNCVHSGISDIAVLVDHQRQYMSEYLSKWKQVNGDSANLHILEPRAGSYQGTADAVYQNFDYIQTHNPDTVLVLAADHVYRINYREMLALHERTGADVTVGAVSVPIEQASRFGIITSDAQGMITDFVEKPQTAMSNLASMGIYVFKRQVLLEHLTEDSRQQSLPHDFGQNVIPRMVRQNKVFAYRFEGYWQDIGTVEAYYEANMKLVRELPSISLNGNWPIMTSDYSPLPPKIINSGNIRNSLVSAGCVVRGKVENSILSHDVTVEERAVVRNSVIMANTVISMHSVVERSILDEHVNVGEFCYIGFGASPIQGDKDITVLGKRVAIPAHSAVYGNCNIISSNAEPVGALSRLKAGSGLASEERESGLTASLLPAK
jgi:glucose-1-phosphate adenylyltransferase